jgi:uncharacterized delta-60 repeat protein
MSTHKRTSAVVGGLVATALACVPALGHERAGLDPTFAGDGTAAADFGGTWSGTGDVATDADGRILVAGTAAPGHDDDAEEFTLARFIAEGSPDPAFGGGDGIVTTSFEINGGELTGGAQAIAVDDEGRIVVGGDAGSFTGDEDTFSAFAFARYLPDGTLDRSFGDGGTLMRHVDVGNSSINLVRTVSIDSRNRILALGYAHNIDGGAAVPAAIRIRPEANSTVPSVIGGSRSPGESTSRWRTRSWGRRDRSASRERLPTCTSASCG